MYITIPAPGLFKNEKIYKRKDEVGRIVEVSQHLYKKWNRDELQVIVKFRNGN